MLAEADPVWAVHRAHVLMFGAWLAVVLVAVARSRWRSRPAPLPRDGWILVAGGASVLSGVVHLAVTPEHFGEAALYGWFFLVLAAAQFAWSAWVWRRADTLLLAAGAAASLLVVILWLATRTVGIPLGPAAGEREAFGWPDIVASATELLVCVGVVGAFLRSRRDLVRTRAAALVRA